jgi:Asp-tRNA(Asn)/Glu-tRNA(Gln) amidotransferase B subunit
LRGDIPEELEVVIQQVVGSVPFKQYCEGNEKALNSCVGMVMKQYKTDPALIKELLIRRKND